MPAALLTELKQRAIPCNAKVFLALEDEQYAANLMCAVSTPFLLQVNVSSKS
jgi:hypothetical protein